MSAVDLSNFLSSLAGNFEGVVQYNRDNRAFEGAVDTNVTIPVLCNLMDDETIDPLQRSASPPALPPTSVATAIDVCLSGVVTAMQM